MRIVRCDWSSCSIAHGIYCSSLVYDLRVHNAPYPHNPARPGLGIYNSDHPLALQHLRQLTTLHLPLWPQQSEFPRKTPQPKAKEKTNPSSAVQAMPHNKMERAYNSISFSVHHLLFLFAQINIIQADIHRARYCYNSPSRHLDRAFPTTFPPPKPPNLVSTDKALAHSHYMGLRLHCTSLPFLRPSRTSSLCIKPEHSH